MFSSARRRPVPVVHRRAARRGLLAVGLSVALALVGLVPAAPAFAAGDPCGPEGNPVACENSKPGNPAAEWALDANSPDIEGFASGFSYDVGERVDFKIRTDAAAYTVDIYRMGWYGGAGARKVATLTTSVPLPQAQPACLSEVATGLVDCGNWAVSASWVIPLTAASGVYSALLRRGDTGAASHVPFVVRNDAGRSDIVLQTADTTWQAYNFWGGNSFYKGSPVGRAYKISYNRPFNNPEFLPHDYFFGAEYPLVRFLERNGYDVSYMSGIDVDRRGALLRNHKVYVSVGHDEYWSGEQRANVEAARDAGVHLAFFSGNEIFWKTRWEPSIDGTGTPYRTLVTYKETWSDAKIDPAATWTGTWMDPRFSPPADGGRPQNALSGTLFTVNCCARAIKVPAADGKMRFWRNTTLADLAAGTTATLAEQTLGYEWDEDVDNGFRPAGLVRMSTSTYTDVEQKFIDYGTQVAPGTATHHLTLYKAPSGALVFGAGTIQWSWGLDAFHAGDATPTDDRMRQATVNLFADMDIQPFALMAGLLPATKSTDSTAPTATITSPAAGATVRSGTTITVTGTAADAGGGRVGGVEVSGDGGLTWHPATGRENWSYTLDATAASTIRARAVDDSGNLQAPPTVQNVDGTCPCGLFGASATPKSSDPDGTPIEVGVKFRPGVAGVVTGVRFHKGAGNGGTHVGSLWRTDGTRLAQVTFTGETASGWQTAEFAEPVPVAAGTTYVASYYAPQGRTSNTSYYFLDQAQVSPPLTAPRSPDVPGGNGVYRYGSSGFPTDTWYGGNYWVDAVFDTAVPPDTTPPAVTASTPADGATGVTLTVRPRVTFSEDVAAASVGMTLRTAAGEPVVGAVAYDPSTRRATFTPATDLAPSTDHVLAVSGATDAAGNTMTAVSKTFRTAAGALGPVSTLFAETATPAVDATADTGAVQLGVKFSPATDGVVTGVRFYKGTGNGGTHTGSLWTSSGTRLAQATFSAESATGWQRVEFDEPVPVTAGTTYVASYHAPQGHYAYTGAFFASPLDNPPLHAPAGANGVYAYGPASAFPANSYNSANYWVDVVFASAAPPPADVTAPKATALSPAADATGVTLSTRPSATFDEALVTSGLAMSLTGPGTTAVAGTFAYDAATRRVTFSPAGALAENTTYTGRVTGIADAAGNTAPPVSWSFTTVADATPPSITAVAASGSGTTATVTWRTDEAASSAVDYGTDPAALTLTATTSGRTTEHSVALTGLTPNTRYHYRVRSADAAGNTTVRPAATADPASYVPAVQPVAFSTRAEFATGSGGYVGETVDGEVTSAPTRATEFTATAQPSGFQATRLATGGGITYPGGTAALNGARLATSTAWATPRATEFRATLAASGNGQLGGFGGSSATAVPYAVFRVASGALEVRTATGVAPEQATALPGVALGAPHTFKVEWTATDFRYYVDGALVATHTPSQSGMANMRGHLADPAAAAPSLVADWFRVLPYNASSTYLSAVVDASAPVAWGTLSRQADVQAGTGLTVQVRTGDTATPGTGWSAWRTVPAAGGPIGATTRYAQFRLVLTTSGTRFVSATVSSVQLTFSVV